MFKKLAGGRDFVFPEYGPVASHGDPIHHNFYRCWTCDLAHLCLLWHGQFLLPSSGNGRQVGRVGNRAKKSKTRSSRNEVLYIQKCSQTARYVLHALPASHGPYSEISENQEKSKNPTTPENPPLYSGLFPHLRLP